jgi:hypothetical protein
VEEGGLEMKKLNIKRFASAEPGTFEMYTHYTENYDTFGNCTSVTVSTVASLDIIQITKNGVDVSSEWSNVPSPYISKEYTSNITETLTFYGSNGQEHVETIDIISVDTNPVIPPEFYASDANIKINSDVKVGKMSLKEIDDTVSALFDLIYPVGSIYYTNNANFNPNASFNGTWEQIKDVFLLAAGDTYTGGTSGGEATHKLTKEELPYLEGTFPHVGGDESMVSGIVFHVGGGTAEASIGYRGNVSVHKIAFGGDQAHNNMPPYIVVYVWKRVL